MIVFDKLWKIMDEKGVSTYFLREKCGIDSKTIRRLKANENIETKTLDKICSALDCRLEDIAEYVKEQTRHSFEPDVSFLCQNDVTFKYFYYLTFAYAFVCTAMV